MKYIKPEIEIKSLTNNESIASGLDGWLNGSTYQDAQYYITDFEYNS